MLNILLKTLVCHYLHWDFFPAIFVLHLLIFSPFCTRFYFAWCVFVFFYFSTLLSGTHLSCTLLNQCPFVPQHFDNMLLAVRFYLVYFFPNCYRYYCHSPMSAILWLIWSIIIWYTCLICYSIHKKRLHVLILSTVIIKFCKTNSKTTEYWTLMGIRF